MPQLYKLHLTELEQELLEDVAKAYGLSHNIQLIANFVVWGNRIVVAFSIEGQNYFLKQWPSFVESDDELAYRLAVQDRARKRGLPVPLILSTINSNRIFCWRERRFSLQHFVGSSYNPELRHHQIMACATSLGKYHSAVLGETLGGKRWKDDPFAESMNVLLRAKDALLGSQLQNEEKEHVLSLISEMNKLLKLTRQKMEHLGWFRLPIMPIHGDFCQFNCRFDGNQVVGIVDWDHSRLAPRL